MTDNVIDIKPTKGCPVCALQNDFAQLRYNFERIVISITFILRVLEPHFEPHLQNGNNGKNGKETLLVIKELICKLLIDCSSLDSVMNACEFDLDIINKGSSEDQNNA
jgi:hypothetical protein